MKTKTQTYSNHARIAPLYHYLTFLAMVVLIAGAIWVLFENGNSSRLAPWLFLLLVLTLVSVSLHSRSFALKAQDRAIRAEENLRYFILTGRRLNQHLTLKQIIALRFAGDEEFADLVEKAASQHMTPREIKKSIRNWRPDLHRV